MPAYPPDKFEAVLRRWRRAFVVARVVDAVWLAVVLGGLAAVLRPGFGVAGTWPVWLAAVVGFVLGWRPVPTLGGIAALLDVRFQSDDLLASGWASRQNTPDTWQATLVALAAARAVALPAPSGLGRRSPRQHFCAIAALFALAVAVRLLPTPHLATPAIATAPAGEPAPFVADVRRRIPDTADEATNWPTLTPTDDASAAARSARPSGEGSAAAGEGRSDVARASASPDRTSASRAPSPKAGTGGSGIASHGVGHGTGDGRVAADPSDGRTTAAGDRPAEALDAPAEFRAAEVPEPYRALVNDFFER